MDHALIYCRVSTEEQAEKGYSLDAQEKICRELAERSGFTVAAVFRDEGRSGTKLDRPALQDLLERSKADPLVKAVFVQETDRLARNTQDHLAIKAILHKAGVRVISAAQPMLDDSPEGKMVDTILASVNQFQSDLNGRKTRKGMQEKFEEGWWPGRAPVGYLNVQTTENGPSSRRVRATLARDPDAWHVLREGFRLFLTGDYSADQVNDLLYQRGLRTRRGQKLAHSVFTRLLRNPFYAGQMQWNRQLGTGNHEPMITLAEHRQVLTILADHRHHACRRRKHLFLLRGYVRCMRCGRRYTAERRPAKHKDYYHCTGGGRHGNMGQYVEAVELERQVAEEFKRIELKPEFADQVHAYLERIAEEQREQDAAERQTLHNRRQAIEAARDQAEAKLLIGVLDDEAYMRQRERSQRELQEIQVRLQALDDGHEQNLDAIRSLLHLLRDVYGGYCAASFVLKRQYLALFWDTFQVQDRRIVQAVPSRFVLALHEEALVQIRPSGGAYPSAIRTLLQDRGYLLQLRHKLAEFGRLGVKLAA